MQQKMGLHMFGQVNRHYTSFRQFIIAVFHHLIADLATCCRFRTNSIAVFYFSAIVSFLHCRCVAFWVHLMGKTAINDHVQVLKIADFNASSLELRPSAVSNCRFMDSPLPFLQIGNNYGN